MENIKQNILDLVDRASSLIPDEPANDLPPLDGFLDVPGWHDYELEIWKIGEEIRHILNKHTNLRKDHQLQDAYLEIINNHKAKRGRQSFFFLIGYKACNRCSEIVASQLDDPKVIGHAITALRKIGNQEYIDRIQKYKDHPVTWIRNEAKKYVSKFVDA
ncbi:hypothetical protein KA005_83820 [bacterium]|nr:hypothetical protein [bacterium]